MYSSVTARDKNRLMKPQKWREPGVKVDHVKACILVKTKQASEVESISSRACDKSNPADFDLAVPRDRSIPM